MLGAMPAMETVGGLSRIQSCPAPTPIGVGPSSGKDAKKLGEDLGAGKSQSAHGGPLTTCPVEGRWKGRPRKDAVPALPRFSSLHLVETEAPKGS